MEDEIVFSKFTFPNKTSHKPVSVNIRGKKRKIWNYKCQKQQAAPESRWWFYTGIKTLVSKFQGTEHVYQHQICKGFFFPYISLSFFVLFTLKLSGAKLLLTINGTINMNLFNILQKKKPNVDESLSKH